MLLEPKDVFAKLEFDKILELLRNNCTGELARTAIDALPIETDVATIERKLLETREMKMTIQEGDAFPMETYEDVASDLRLLRVPDYVLAIEGLQRLARVLHIAKNIFGYFSSTRQNSYPSLFDLLRPLSHEAELLRLITATIDEEGNVRPNASPELARLFQLIASKQREMDRLFKSIIQHYKAKGQLTDTVESFRNGRRVLSVPAEHKRSIRGIIHDESATGRTAFIEPEGVIDINNDIFDLENEVKREIYRLLKALSASLRPYVQTIADYQDVIVMYDIILAKAKLAHRMKADMPKLLDAPHIGIVQGYHPLLLLKNKEEGKRTVPFSLTFLHHNRILVLSGPNAGGKSVTMKAVGLMQLMLQAGLLLPLNPESEMGVFEQFFADIGDQQSLEDDLSTYSSRLRNMRIFLEKANPKTLVLIDEFGSGTDPLIGGAIAEAILRELNYKKVYGVITTHYSNIKVFAFKNKGLLNGSMVFDMDALSPTYELKVGRPGSSYAYEIAQKSGLDHKVLEYARHKIGKNEKAVDELLVDLQREKQEVEEKLHVLAEKERNADRLVKTYEQMQRDLEFQRKKHKLDVKQTALQKTAANNKDFEKLVRKIKEEKDLEKAKELALKLREEREKLHEQVEQLYDDVYETQQNGAKPKPIQAGDFVKFISGGTTGTVESVGKKDAVVIVGEMRMTCKLRDLVPANTPLDIRKQKRIQTDIVEQSARFEPKLDLRGMSREDALRILESFMDNAITTSTDTLRIIHGKGNGVLRKAVRDKLREYKAVKNTSHPEENEGGDGVTLVSL
jgi:DNA mismatch repair protein MutS2